MIRRENRLRREYIYRKSLEEKQRAIEEKREKIKDALENNKKIDTALRKDAIELANGAEWGGQIMSIDDEYRWAGTKDPKIVITTSREPSSKLKVFVKAGLMSHFCFRWLGYLNILCIVCFKEMKLVFPNAQRLNRGHYDVKQLVQACRANDVTDFILLTETRGNPDGMVVCHLPFGPTAYFTLFNVVMRHDIPDREPMSEQYPHLIFHNLDSKLGQRFTSILKYLFPVPKENSRRVITFANFDDFISFRHHTYTVVQGGEIELKEAGPRFELRPYAIKLGTLENIAAAEDEWVLRSFMNTSRKRQLLSNKEEESDEED
ncbi:unnamed protein product [Haemonchus placei]|uniref:Brix domain-containing protein n=1 Tax=Haemonchus placei TaxID=6290 RepID=A0A0N4WS96_HAEPC|nr:unnamed protein product [Haemonchus placei]